MGTILAASLQGRKCYRGGGMIQESPHSDSKLCRVLSALFLCTFGLTAYYVTKPETFWLRFARVGILTLTCTSAFMILIPSKMITAAWKCIKIPDFTSKFRFPSSDKLVLSVTSRIKTSKNRLTIDIPPTIDSNIEHHYLTLAYMEKTISLLAIEMPTIIESKYECPLKSPLGSSPQSSLPPFENINEVS